MNWFKSAAPLLRVAMLPLIRIGLTVIVVAIPCSFKLNTICEQMFRQQKHSGCADVIRLVRV